MSENIEVQHPNGYIGILYGKRSMVILDKNRKEVMHTGFRNKNIKTEKDLYKLLEGFPEFLKMISEADKGSDIG